MGMFDRPETQHFTRMQRELMDRLAEIEAEDADACAHCGGEDCICCEIYQDRQRWDPDILDHMESDNPYYA